MVRFERFLFDSAMAGYDRGRHAVGDVSGYLSRRLQQLTDQNSFRDPPALDDSVVAPFERFWAERSARTSALKQTADALERKRATRSPLSERVVQPVLRDQHALPVCSPRPPAITAARRQWLEAQLHEVSHLMQAAKQRVAVNEKYKTDVVTRKFDWQRRVTSVLEQRVADAYRQLNARLSHDMLAVEKLKAVANELELYLQCPTTAADSDHDQQAALDGSGSHWQFLEEQCSSVLQVARQSAQRLRHQQDDPSELDLFNEAKLADLEAQQRDLESQNRSLSQELADSRQAAHALQVQLDSSNNERSQWETKYSEISEQCQRLEQASHRSGVYGTMVILVSFAVIGRQTTQ